jgi:hypothetical protein
MTARVPPKGRPALLLLLLLPERELVALMPLMHRQRLLVVPLLKVRRLLLLLGLHLLPLPVCCCLTALRCAGGVCWSCCACWLLVCCCWACCCWRVRSSRCCCWSDVASACCWVCCACWFFICCSAGVSGALPTSLWVDWLSLRGYGRAQRDVGVKGDRMDVAAIAAGTAALLAAPAATAAAGEAGKSLWAGLVAVVRRKFAGDHDAMAVLQRVVAEPSPAHQAAVAVLLQERADDDESFARELGRLLNAAQSLPELSQVMVNVSGNATIGKQANIGTNIGDINL